MLRRLSRPHPKPEEFVWIFGSERTGSTWLSRMMGEFGTVWNEPLVGLMFGDFYRRTSNHADKRPGDYLFGEPREAWLHSIGRFVLEQARAKFPEAGLLIVKEPNGSVGAPLLMEALPESRMVALVRDPRDAVASSLAAHQKGGWLYANTGEAKRRPWAGLPDEDPDTFVRQRAKYFAANVGSALAAYDSHRGRKALVRYEDLRSDPATGLRGLFSALDIEIKESEIPPAVHRHAWENIPEEERGEGKFNRKATPGSWREDLTPRQSKIVERLTADVIQRLYPA